MRKPKLQSYIFTGIGFAELVNELENGMAKV